MRADKLSSLVTEASDRPFTGWAPGAGPLANLLREPQAGYRHTLREICQQPATWTETACAILPRLGELRDALAACDAVVLTGSGSSQFAGECVHPLWQEALGIPVQTAGSGEILLRGRAALPPGRLGLISLARSGNSPESVAVVEVMREAAPDTQHIIVTCNAEGKLAALHHADPRIIQVVLDERTNDQSLVMTSSFTNMVIAARGIASCNGDYVRDTNALASAARILLSGHAGKLQDIAAGGFSKAFFLGSGCRYGSARESALKLLEMTDGRVLSFAENCLGLRHGPMCAVDGETLVVALLSSDPLRRAYEADLLGELKRKGIAGRRVIVGRGVPRELVLDGDLAIDFENVGALTDDDLAVLDVLVGQMLGFFRCLAEGLEPDAPSKSGVISRVVNAFTVHHRGEREPAL